MLGSSTTWRSSVSQRPRVSVRLRARSGRRTGSPMPAVPGTPAPRRRFSNTVSAWSSAVWPVSTPSGRTARRTSRARCSRSGPSSTGPARMVVETPRLAAVWATRWVSSADVGRRLWLTVQQVTSRPAATASTNRAVESGPPETAQSTAVPAGGKTQRPSRSSTSGPVRPPVARSTGPARGSHPDRAGGMGPPKPGPVALNHRGPLPLR